MLGFKTKPGPAKVGDLLVDNTSMHPWGATLWEVVEVLVDAPHSGRNPFMQLSDTLQPDGSYRVQNAAYKVRVYNATALDKGVEVFAVKSGWSHIRVLQATKEEYLRAWNARRQERPMWKKEEWALYDQLRSAAYRRWRDAHSTEWDAVHSLPSPTAREREYRRLRKPLHEALVAVKAEVNAVARERRDQRLAPVAQAA